MDEEKKEKAMGLLGYMDELVSGEEGKDALRELLQERPESALKLALEHSLGKAIPKKEAPSGNDAAYIIVNPTSEQMDRIRAQVRAELALDK